MDVDIQASLPKLKKQGRLQALRRISSLGRITYEMLKFEGDGTVKNNVIARYLTAEAQAQNTDEMPSLSVTPENYKFKYKGPGTTRRTQHPYFSGHPTEQARGPLQGRDLDRRGNLLCACRSPAIS